MEITARVSNFSLCLTVLFVLTMLWNSLKPNEKEHEEIKSVEWPEHWKAVLRYADALQLVLLDPTALRCASRSDQEEARFGTMMIDFDNFYDLTNKTMVEPSEGKMSFYDYDPIDDPDTVVVRYSYTANIDKFIIITVRNRRQAHRNYHLLRGSDVTSTLAVPKFSTADRIIGGYKIIIPKDIRSYLIYAQNGRFLECNQESTAFVDTNATRLIPITAIKLIAKFVDVFIQNGQIPFLSFGSLLGWYRDCGIIPHTHDIDFNVFADEYNPSIEKLFINHPEFPLKHRIGKREHSVEYTFTLHHRVPGYNSTPVDIFYLYPHNATHEWNPFLADFYQLIRGKSISPKVTGLCSADLYGFLFFVPCNYIEILTANYGSNFMETNPYSAYFDEGNQNLVDGYWNLTKEEVVYLFNQE